METNVRLYHGSKEQFKEFSLDFVGKNGTAQGFGVYLTPNKEVAEMYSSPNGYLYEVNAKLGKELSLDKVTLSRRELKSLIEKLEQSHNILSNYGDVSYEGYNAVINEALELIYTNESDMDIINDIANTLGDKKAVSEALYKLSGYTHLWAEEQTRLKDKVCIVLDPSYIEIENITELKPSQLGKLKDLDAKVEKDVGDKPLEKDLER